MAKQSAYLQRREAELDAAFNAGAAMAMQFAVLSEIIRGKAKLIPFPDRYKELKKVRYGR